MLNVRLVHGWLSDPQDAVTHGVVGKLTYNQLVEKVIELSSSQPTCPASHRWFPAVAAIGAAPPASERDKKGTSFLCARPRRWLSGAVRLPGAGPALSRRVRVRGNRKHKERSRTNIAYRGHRVGAEV